MSMHDTLDDIHWHNLLGVEDNYLMTILIE